MKNVYIVTHTESVHHVQKLVGGWYDTPLTEKGKEQAAKFATGLYKEIKLSGIQIYSSDLKRAEETADAFAKVFSSSVIINKNLREMNFGECGGKSQEWVKANIVYPPAEGNGLDHRLFKGAESRRECGQRAYAFINRLLETPDNDAIVVTHGHFRTYLILAWLKVPVEGMGYAAFPAGPGTVTRLSENENYRERNVEYLNRMDFLNEQIP
jgi:2,3-bisphosphoglycerate-dependent phosphoglycerate mutase